MEYSNSIYDNLSYSEQLIAEKLGIHEMADVSKPKPNPKNNKLLEQQILNKLMEPSQVSRTEVPDNFNVGYKPTYENQQREGFKRSNQENDLSLIDIDKKTLILFIFVLLMVCIIQCVNQHQLNANMNNILSMLIKANTINHSANAVSANPVN